MSRRMLIPLCALVALGLLGAGLAQGELRQAGNVRISFSGDFAPQSLPRDRLAPISVHVRGAITTTDGTHPPPVRRVEIGLNRNGKLTTVGLPACTGQLLQSTSTKSALQRCRPSLVGSGRFGAVVEFPATDPFPASGRALAFFGKSGGGQTLFLHLYITAPVQTTFIVPLRIRRGGEGAFGTTLAARIPTLAGGLGSVTELDLTIGRTYTYRGQRHSFISAACAAPAGFTMGSFPLARGSFFFEDGRKIETTLARTCRVR